MILHRRFYYMNGTRMVAENVMNTLRSRHIPFREKSIYVSDPHKKHFGTVSALASSLVANAHSYPSSISFTSLAPANIIFVPDIGVQGDHSMSDNLIHRMSSIALRKSRYAWTNTNYMRNVLHSTHGLDHDNVLVTPLPVSNEYFHFELSGEVDADRIVITTIGMLSKRREALLAIPHALRQAFPSHNIVLIHIAPYHPNNALFDSSLRKYGINGIRLVDPPLQYVMQLVSQSSFYVYLSSMEGYSLTPKEALALGTPALISHNPVHDEIYTGKPGIVMYDGVDSLKAIAETPHSKNYAKWALSYSYDDLVDKLLPFVQ